MALLYIPKQFDTRAKGEVPGPYTLINVYRGGRFVFCCVQISRPSREFVQFLVCCGDAQPNYAHPNVSAASSAQDKVTGFKLSCVLEVFEISLYIGRGS